MRTEWGSRGAWASDVKRSEAMSVLVLALVWVCRWSTRAVRRGIDVKDDRDMDGGRLGP